MFTTCLLKCSQLKQKSQLGQIKNQINWCFQNRRAKWRKHARLQFVQEAWRMRYLGIAGGANSPPPAGGPIGLPLTTSPHLMERGRKANSSDVSNEKEFDGDDDGVDEEEEDAIQVEEDSDSESTSRCPDRESPPNALAVPIPGTSAAPTSPPMDHPRSQQLICAERLRLAAQT